jgi:tRNA nucleotidyltransferase (CCA-adding enzyme)
VTVHDRFGTATVRVRNLAFDLASARRERYPRPGSLPDVELGVPMREDLERRDFTVNAMAVPVDGSDAVLHPRALGDLDAGVLRVLHGASFVDDPTRLLRLVRYAARLDFTADSHTAALAGAAVEGRALDTVSGSRIGSELRLLMAEPRPPAVVGLAAHGIGEAVFPGYAPDADVVERALAAAPEDADAGVVALAAALASGGSAGGQDAEAALGERLAELAFPSRQRDVTARATAAAPGIAAVLRSGATPSAVWSRLRREPPEAIAVAVGLDPAAEQAARRWLDRDRHVRAHITGADLIAAGLSGTQIGRGLEAALRARLDGQAKNREDELAAALAAAG